MHRGFAIGRSLVLVAAAAMTLSGCLGDNCRPSRGGDRGDHHCDRDRDRHRH